MAAPRQLVSVERLGKSFGAGAVLADVSLGIAAGERIGVVGANGAGKSTLLSLVARLDEPDAGRVTWTTDLRVGLLGQLDTLDPARTIRQEVIGGLADHEWAGDRRIREVLEGTLGGVEISRFPGGLDTVIGPLSGGERRRIALAKLLLDGPELLLLDEPTNHLDLEAVSWLAGHLAARRGALVVVTHDRWFLDTVCSRTWEIDAATVREHDGGYAAWVLARAERERVAAVTEGRRRNLLRKELAWLRRGPPARTTKPRFRIDAANALIADEPVVRDRAELLAVRDRAPRALRARRGGRQRHARRPRAPPPPDLAARTRRPRRCRRGQRIGQDDAAPPARRRPRADRGSRAARLDGAPRDALAGPRGACRRRARARGARVRAHAHRARRRAGADRLAALRAVRLRRQPAVGLRRRPLGWRAASAPADATDDGRAERPAARRADERSRHRHPDRARGPARRLARDARRRQP